jgi:hypothetical protein
MYVRKRTITSGNYKHHLSILCICLLIAILLAVSVGYLWLCPRQISQPHLQLTVQPTHFQPVVGDVGDPEHDDPDITVQQSLVPGFQFRTGGYTLSGTVIDAQFHQPVLGAIVWIDLPISVAQPTPVSLHTITDAQGHYQFIHLAAGVYTVVASRYYNLGDGRYYAERIFPPVALHKNRDDLILPLTALSAPGKRSPVAGQAKNVILIDLRGFYVASLLDDPLLVEQTQNIRAFLSYAHVFSSIWQPYGWRPLDQYALLTGTYPSWATYDSWPHTVPWGMPDSLDTTFWFNGNRDMHLFGQESLFDVAKGYGMQTGVVASSGYLLSDATTRSLDVLQRSSTFDAHRWLAQVQTSVLSGMQQDNGFLLYAELASLPSNDGDSSPDAQGDDYQQALLQADQALGQLLVWLDQQNLLHNTLVILTTSQAQANHTDADNFYGMGSTGQGTSKQSLFAMAGPYVCPGVVERTPYSSFSIAPTIMHTLGLPAPAEARLSSLSATPQGRSCS